MFGSIRRKRSKVVAAQRRVYGNIARGGKLYFDVNRQSGGAFRATVCTHKGQLIYFSRRSLRHEGLRRFPRCGAGQGKSPTAALKSALRHMATRLK